MEAHLVHYNTKYSDIGEAVKHKDGLAVLGVFFSISEKDNSVLEPIVDTARNVINKGMEKTLAKVFPLDDLLPEDQSEFFRYSNQNLPG